MALAKFNVVINASDEGQEMKEVDDTYIVKRNTLLGYLDKMTNDSYNIVYEDFFTQRINLLKSMNNAYSKKVLAIFNEEFNKMSEYFLIDKKNRKVTNYKAMNELLDKAFEDLADLEEYKEQEKMFKERILPILTMFIQGAERINSSAMKTVLDAVPKRMKEPLTEPLIDKKQAEESRMNPTVKETSKQTLKREIDASMGKVKTGTKKVSGKSLDDEPVVSNESANSTATNMFRSSVNNSKPRAGAEVNISSVTETHESSALVEDFRGYVGSHVGGNDSMEINTGMVDSVTSGFNNTIPEDDKDYTSESEKFIREQEQRKIEGARIYDQVFKPRSMEGGQIEEKKDAHGEAKSEWGMDPGRI